MSQTIQSYGLVINRTLASYIAFVKPRTNSNFEKLINLIKIVLSLPAAVYKSLTQRDIKQLFAKEKSSNFFTENRSTILKTIVVASFVAGFIYAYPSLVKWFNSNYPPRLIPTQSTASSYETLTKPTAPSYDAFKPLKEKKANHKLIEENFKNFKDFKGFISNKFSTNRSYLNNIERCKKAYDSFGISRSPIINLKSYVDENGKFITNYNSEAIEGLCQIKETRSYKDIQNILKRCLSKKSPSSFKYGTMEFTRLEELETCLNDNNIPHVTSDMESKYYLLEKFFITLYSDLSVKKFLDDPQIKPSLQECKNMYETVEYLGDPSVNVFFSRTYYPATNYCYEEVIYEEPGFFESIFREIRSFNMLSYLRKTARLYLDIFLHGASKIQCDSLSAIPIKKLSRDDFKTFEPCFEKLPYSLKVPPNSLFSKETLDRLQEIDKIYQEKKPYLILDTPLTATFEEISEKCQELSNELDPDIVRNNPKLLAKHPDPDNLDDYFIPFDIACETLKKR